VFGDEVFADVNIRSDNVNFAELKKYIPEDTLRHYGIKDIKGKMLFNAKVRGVVTDTTQMPNVDADLWLENGSISLDSLPDLKNVSFDLAFTNGEAQEPRTASINVKDFRFETGNSSGSMKFTLSNFDKPKYKIKADLNADLSDFAGLISDTLLTDLNGKVKVRLSTSGVMPDSVTDAFLNDALANSFADVTLTGVNAFSDSLPDIRSLSGRIVYKPGSVNITELNVSVPDFNANVRNSSVAALLSGVLTDPEQTIVDLQSFNIRTDSCRFSGTAVVNNLISPEFRINADISLGLGEIMKMMPDDSLVADMSGRIDASIVSEGHLDPDSIADKIMEIVFKNTALHGKAEDVTVSMADTLPGITGLTGSFTLVTDTFTCKDVSGAYKSMTFNVPTLEVFNMYNTVLKNKNERITIFGDVRLGDVDYAVFAPFVDDTTAVSDPEETDKEPANYSFFVKGRFAANSFKYGKAEFRNISALYNLTDSLYIVDKFRFDAFGGSASNSVRYRVKPDGKKVVNIKHLVDKVDVHQMLVDFDNFKEYGNSEIAAENLSGLLSSELHAKLVLEGDSVLENETRVKGEFRIEKGGIYNYKPAMDMAEFTKLKELDSIRFKTFDSKLFMFKNKLYVPKTFIVSSALDIGFFGMQSMDEDYEYHIQLHLGDVMRGKSQKLLKQQAESGKEVSDKDLDRSTVKLIYAYIDGKSKVGFDRKKAQRMMEVKIKTQEKMLDLIFFPKLVSFDTGVE
jgi:hypothetical protein